MKISKRVRLQAYKEYKKFYGSARTYGEFIKRYLGALEQYQ